MTLFPAMTIIFIYPLFCARVILRGYFKDATLLVGYSGVVT